VADTAYANDVAKSAAASCIFPCVALRSVQIESSNMVPICYFYANILEKNVHGIWINMVYYFGTKELYVDPELSLVQRS
jgi:hypothetical protein